MSRPKSFHRLAVENSFASDLPAAPALPVDAFDLDSMEDDFLESAQSAFAESGLMDLVGGLGGQASATEFFGVKASGQRIAIVVNTSASVVRRAAARGVTIEQIQNEAVDLIEGLEGGTSFGVVQFSQGVRGFSERLAPASAKNKRLAAAWVRTELRGNPPIASEEWLGHEAALRAALSLQPDLIFLVTDGSLNRRTANSGGGYSYPKISFERLISFVEGEISTVGANPRIHVIGFELGERERSGLERLVRRFGGSLREF